MKTLILTGYDNNMRGIGDLCAANHKAYAMRHGYDFQCKRDYNSASHPSWQKMEAVNSALANYDRVMWLDADAVVTNPAMTIEEVLGHSEPHALHVSKDWTHPNPEDEIKHFSLGNFVMHAGKEAAELLRLASTRTEWANRPLWEQQAIQEEYRANEAIRPWVKIHHRRTLNSVPALPTTTGPEPWEPQDFLCHLTFIPQEERVRLFQEYDMAGLNSLVPRIPNWHETGMAMDIRHIACLRELMRLLRPAVAIEIGVWKGAASAAFVEAWRHGDIMRYTAVDVGIQPEFLSVITGCEAEIKHMRSTEYLEGLGAPLHDDAFFLVDGDHNLSTVAEETALLLQILPRVVAMHDTRSQEVGFSGCDGPPYMKEALRQAGYTIIEDHKDRPNEMTKRGFCVAVRPFVTTDYQHDVELCQRAFDLTCY